MKFDQFMWYQNIMWTFELETSSRLFNLQRILCKNESEVYMLIWTKIPFSNRGSASFSTNKRAWNKFKGRIFYNFLR